MNRFLNSQRGIADLWVIAIIAILVLGITVWGITAYNKHIETTYKNGYDSGKSEADKVCTEQNNIALQESMKEQDVLRGKIKDLETVNAQQANQLQTQYAKGQNDTAKKYETIVAGLRAGSVVFYDKDGQDCASGSSRAASGPDKVSPAPPGATSPQGSRLSNQLSEYLIGEAKRADQIVNSFNLCIGRLMSDRAACEAAPRQK